MTANWEQLFHVANEHHMIAVFNTAQNTDERVAAVEKWHELIDQFKSGKEQSIPVLESYVDDKNITLRNTAVRLLSELHEPSQLQKLSKKLATVPHNHGLHYSVLKRLWIVSPPPEAYIMPIVSASQQYSYTLISALLHVQTPKSVGFVRRVISDQTVRDYTKLQAIGAISHWNDSDLLWTLFNEYQDEELRLQLAFYIALQGDKQAVDLLTDKIDSSNDEIVSGKACVYLSQLGYPHVVNKVNELLQSDDSLVLIKALDTVYYLACVDLIPALLRLSKKDITDPYVGKPIRDDSLNLAMGMLLKEDHELVKNPQFATYAFPTQYTEQYREKVLKHIAHILPNFAPHKRYHRGEPLNLQNLVDDLSSQHSSPKIRSVYNLRAITGVKSVYDPSADLIANWDSIREWQQYVEQYSSWFAAGGWAYNGQPLTFS